MPRRAVSEALEEKPKRRGRPPKKIADPGVEERKRSLIVPARRFHDTVIHYEGISALICNNPIGGGFEGSGGKGQKAAGDAEDRYDTDVEFSRSLYRLPEDPNSFGLPVAWFRKAAIYTLPIMGWKPKEKGKKHVMGGIFPLGSITPLIYDKKKDPVKYVSRVCRPPRSGRSVEICRAMFVHWEVKFIVRYNVSIFTLEDIYNLFQMAGTVCGFGDHRPGCGGTNGMAQLKNVASGLEL